MNNNCEASSSSYDPRAIQNAVSPQSQGVSLTCDLSSLSEDSFHQNMVKNKMAMTQNTQLIIAENQVHRPKNTTVAYEKKQQEWRVCIL